MVKYNKAFKAYLFIHWTCLNFAVYVEGRCTTDDDDDIIPKFAYPKDSEYTRNQMSIMRRDIDGKALDAMRKSTNVQPGMIGRKIPNMQELVSGATRKAITPDNNVDNEEQDSSSSSDESKCENDEGESADHTLAENQSPNMRTIVKPASESNENVTENKNRESTNDGQRKQQDQSLNNEAQQPEDVELNELLPQFRITLDYNQEPNNFAPALPVQQTQRRNVQTILQMPVVIVEKPYPVWRKSYNLNNQCCDIIKMFLNCCMN